MKQNMEFFLNDQPVKVELDGSETLLWVLRAKLKATGTKYGCGFGHCGACTVLVDREPLRSCTLMADFVEGKKVVTIEGLAKNGQLHPVQKAFVEKDALQCGYCTPGMIMNATGLLYRNPEPTEKEIKEGMEENLCRCGSYFRIVEAIQIAAKEMKGGQW